MAFVRGASRSGARVTGGGLGRTTIAGTETGPFGPADLSARAAAGPDTSLGGAWNAGGRGTGVGCELRLGSFAIANGSDVADAGFSNARIDIAELALALRAQDSVTLVHADRLEMANAFIHGEAAGEVPGPVGEVLALNGCARAAHGDAHRSEKQSTDIGA